MRQQRRNMALQKKPSLSGCKVQADKCDHEERKPYAAQARTPTRLLSDAETRSCEVQMRQVLSTGKRSVNNLRQPAGAVSTGQRCSKLSNDVNGMIKGLNRPRIFSSPSGKIETDTAGCNYRRGNKLRTFSHNLSLVPECSPTGTKNALPPRTTFLVRRCLANRSRSCPRYLASPPITETEN